MTPATARPRSPHSPFSKGKEARDREILSSRRVYAGAESIVDVAPQEMLTLKGFRRPVAAYRVLALKPAPG